MVSITLTNHNSQSKDKQVVINIKTGQCVFPDNRQMALKYFIKSNDFLHPLLNERVILNNDYIFHYEYNNLKELFCASIFVYSTLLQVDEPSLCTFKINPSAHYQSPDILNDLYFSIDCGKAASETITISQLNQIVSQSLNIEFVFTEDFIINDVFNMDNLPSTVNGDLLYILDEEKLAVFEHPADLSRFELRYINPKLGFGVYCKKPIKKGDLLTFYAGVKSTNPQGSLNYAFKPGEDCMNMILNAKYFGNITRFINHAPDLDINKEAIDVSLKLTANAQSLIYYLRGMAVILYYAKKDIMPGEQILVSYGDTYFKEKDSLKFKKNGHLEKAMGIDSANKFFHLKIMANNGVRKAQTYLFLRWVSMVIIICLAVVVLRILG